ncbi:MAG TPA: hypothetical protein VGA03_08100, partial [Anaerolineales bacterium]
RLTWPKPDAGGTRMKFETKFLASKVQCPPEKASAWRKAMLDLMQIALSEKTQPHAGEMGDAQSYEGEEKMEFAY